MAEDDDQKTEEPSQRRLDEAKREGRVPQSKEVVNWFIMLATAGTMLLLAKPLATSLTKSTVRYFEQAHTLRIDDDFTNVLFDTAMGFGFDFLMPFVVIVIAVITANVVQNGLIFAPEKMMPKFEHVSPMSGFKRIFSWRNVIELTKGLIKVGIVCAVAIPLLAPEMDRLSLLPSMDTAQILHELQGLTLRMISGVGGAVTAIAILDFGYQRFSFMRSMRTTRQEAREEYKQQEGDPVIRAKLRQIRIQRSRQRMMAAVPDASVIVTNPTHYSVALAYELGAKSAPKVVAKGADLVALRIRELAREHNIPIVENPPVARALYAAVEIDQEIPEEHYRAVAEIISYVFKLKGKMRRN